VFDAAQRNRIFRGTPPPTTTNINHRVNASTAKLTVECEMESLFSTDVSDSAGFNDLAVCRTQIATALGARHHPGVSLCWSLTLTHIQPRKHLDRQSIYLSWRHT